MAGTTTNDRLAGGAGRCSAGGGSGALRTLAVIHAGRRLVGALLAILLLMAAVLSGSAWAQPLGSRALGIAAETNKAPKVTKQPVKLTVEEGQSASFTSTASGVPTPTIQWELSTNGGGSWSPVEGATSTTITIASAKTSENGNQYRAVFKNGVPPDATSSAATLTVQKAPVVTQQPVSTTVEEGQSAVFEAAASGFPTPTIQWQLSTNGGATWSNVPGATSEKLTIANTKTSFSGHQYRAVFKNGTPPKEAISEAAALTVRKAPAVTKQPASTTVNEGQNATFEAVASGFPAPSVQWEVSTDAGSSWSLVEGATANTLTLEKTVASQSGNQYRAVFT
ncbi:MAG: immunoglobulin domain-containing protein, partial [Actinomycetota bacterium]|nr:immunoglobulin domain-containing protein [Actinomycetota bacterium]